MTRPLAFVTGTSRGIGLAVARQLLGRGWEVCGLARGAAPAGLGDPHYAHRRLDLADLAATRAVFEDELPARLALDDRTRVALVNNAGVLDIEPVTAMTPEGLARSLTVNVAVPVWLTGWLVRRAEAAAAVRIAQVSSGAATSAYPGWAAYCAAKAALDIASEVAALELDELPGQSGRDVRILSFAPGVVETAMQEQIRAASESAFPRRQRFVDMHEHGELLEPGAPAAVLADFLDSGGGPRFTRARMPV